MAGSGENPQRSFAERSSGHRLAQRPQRLADSALVELPILESERLTLRPLSDEEVEALLPAVYEPGIAEWWGDTSDPDYQREGLRNEGRAFAIYVGDEVAGWLGFHEELEPDYKQAALDIMLLPIPPGPRPRPRSPTHLHPLADRRSRPPSLHHRPSRRQRPRHRRLRLHRLQARRHPPPERARP